MLTLQLRLKTNALYDSLNRLKSATENIDGNQTPSWKQTFTFDRYGNRTFDEANTTTLPRNCGSKPSFTVCPADNPAASTTDNRLNGFTFDNAGNTEEDPNGREFTYDGENKQILVRDSSGNTIGEYFYDGDGKRVKKVEFSSNVAVQTTIFIYDASSKLVAEYATNVEQVSTARVSYLTSDHLGSPRITTDKDGRVFSRRDFMPFGEEIDSSTTPQRSIGHDYGEDGLRQKFTSYERDEETDLDFAQARMYVNRLGRFTTIDPLLSTGKLGNPQTWNRYSYTINSPLKYTDPTGAYIFTEDLGGARRDEDLIRDAGDDKKRLKTAENIIKKRHKIRDAMTKAKEAGAKSDNPGLVNQAVDSYGDYLVDNGVVVGFGNAGGSPGVTNGFRGANGGLFRLGGTDGKTFTANILVIFNENESEEDFINAVAHEGQHVKDRQSVANALTSITKRGINLDFLDSPWNVTQRTTETRAYTVSALVAQGRNQTTWNPDGYEIWNSSWRAADRMENISKGIDKLLTNSKTYKNKLGEKLYPK